MASRLNVAVAVWRKAGDRMVYAFALSSPGGEPAVWGIDEGGWVFEGVLQPGARVAEVRPAPGAKVRARAGRGHSTIVSPLFAFVPSR